MDLHTGKRDFEQKIAFSAMPVVQNAWAGLIMPTIMTREVTAGCQHGQMAKCTTCALHFAKQNCSVPPCC